MRKTELAIIGLLVGLAALAAGAPAQAATEEQEAKFRDYYRAETVVRWEFAPGRLPFAGAILSHDSFGEWVLLTLEKSDVEVVKSGKLKLEQVQRSAVDFVAGGAHAFVQIAERMGNDEVMDLAIYDMANQPGNELFRMDSVYNPGIDLMEPAEILLWQKGTFYFSQQLPPFKYNYFTIAYDQQFGNYKFGSYMRVMLTGGDQGVLLNNRAVQVYCEGDLKSALAKLGDAALIAQSYQAEIMRNQRFLRREMEVLAERRAPGAATGLGDEGDEGTTVPAPVFNDTKLHYLLGDYDMVLMSIGGSSARYRPDDLALMGMAYARKKNYAELQRITRVLVENRYAALTPYYEDVSEVIFYNRDLPQLKAHLRVLEKREPLSPKLNFLKAAVLADAGRYPFAQSMLETYLSHVSDDQYDLSGVREFLYEMAMMNGDKETASRTYKRLMQAPKRDLRAIAYLLSFTGRPRTEIITVSPHLGERIEVPEGARLERFAPVEGVPPLVVPGQPEEE